MRINDLFALAFLNIKKQRTRTLLSIVSIFIGVFAVLIIYMVTSTSKYEIMKYIDEMGINGIAVYSLYNNEDNYLQYSHIDFLKKRLKSIESAMPVVNEMAILNSNHNNYNTFILGVDDNLNQTINVKLVSGRSISEGDVTNNSRVCIIDRDFAKSIFKNEDPIGKMVSLNINGYDENFRIIGIINSQKVGIESVIGESMPDIMYVPYSTINEITASDSIDQIIVKCFGNTDIENTKNDIINILNTKSEMSNSTGAQNITGIIDTVEYLINTILIIISSIAFISFIVAIIGVCNTTISSISERRREIGIYMALGSTKNDIIKCFVLESIYLCFIGSIAAVILSILIAFFIGQWFGIRIHLEPIFILATLIISILSGSLIGIIPIKKISSLNPIDALRDI